MRFIQSNFLEKHIEAVRLLKIRISITNVAQLTNKSGMTIQKEKALFEGKLKCYLENKNN